MNMERKTAFVWMLALSSVGVLARLLDHQPNFAPITALALIAGFYLPKKWSLIVPLAAMLASDIVIGFYDLPVMAAVYGSYAIAWALARFARASESKSALIPATLFSSLIFFALTNAAVWAFTPMYAKTAAGLYQSYAMAVPFFKWALAADIIYTVAFVGIIETVMNAKRSMITYGLR
jgi:hypothetical protein